MAEHLFPHDESPDRPDVEFTAEVELLRGATILPKLSRCLRTRVLDAATFAYRATRRWSQVRHATAFLALCLGTSWALSPLATVAWPKPSALMARLAQIRPSCQVASATTSSFVQQREYSLPASSVWALSHNREFLHWPSSSASQPRRRPASTLVRTDDLPPRDKLLATLESSDGWDTVDAFAAIRDRGQASLQRAGWTN